MEIWAVVVTKNEPDDGEAEDGGVGGGMALDGTAGPAE